MVQLTHPYVTTGKTIGLTAAAAKLLQSCPTLWDTMDFSIPGSSVHGIFQARVLEKEMATHSSVLAWKIPGTEEPGGLPSMVSHRVGHD